MDLFRILNEELALFSSNHCSKEKNPLLLFEFNPKFGEWKNLQNKLVLFY